MKADPLQRWTFAAALSVIAVIGAAPARGAFNIQYSYQNAAAFTASQLAILNAGLAEAEAMWESALTGYQAGISIAAVPIQIRASASGLASANFSGTISQGGFRVTTSGFININVNEIENFADWQGHGANGLNFIDELMAHETGHVLGIGTLWDDNDLYVNGAFRYTGQHGLAAYRAEFDPTATFVPVENAGSGGTIGSHWDQRMRSSSQEGNPNDPWSLDPRVGVVDAQGRDRGLELMTGAIDPDHLEPFLSRFTVESMRDLGYTVAAFEDFNGDGVVDLDDRAILFANIGMAELGTDSFSFGDANRDRKIDVADLRLWEQAAGVPEPHSLALAAMALVAVRTIRRKARSGG